MYVYCCAVLMRRACGSPALAAVACIVSVLSHEHLDAVCVLDNETKDNMMYSQRTVKQKTMTKIKGTGGGDRTRDLLRVKQTR